MRSPIGDPSQPAAPLGPSYGGARGAYGHSTGPWPPPAPVGSRGHCALIAVAVVAGILVLAAAFGGAVGTTIYIRRLTQPAAGSTQVPRGGGGSTRIINLGTLAHRLDPSIVDLNGIQQNASGQTIAQDAGTGVIVTTSGEVLTNNHVIAGNTSMTATLSTGRTVGVKVLGEDPSADIALLQLQGVSNLPAIDLQNGATASI
ncbi:MAG: trypsin-like peptidase domain-containing protein, partial [Trebonia sp.]